VATNCVLTAPLCHVGIVRLLCSELSLILSSLLLYACSVFFNKLNNNNNNNNNDDNNNINSNYNGFIHFNRCYCRFVE